MNQSNSSSISPASTPPPSARKSNHSTNYTVDEDKQLCKTWCAISTDPIVGRGQKGAVLWEKIKRHFDKESFSLPTYVESFGLKAKWAIIQRSVSKYTGHLEQARRLMESGTNNTTNLVTKTNESILEKEPKWKKINDDKRDDSIVNASNANVASIDLDARPDGRKKEKARKATEAITRRTEAEVNNTMIESLNVWRNVNKKRALALESKDDDAIMSKNLTLIVNAEEL